MLATSGGQLVLMSTPFGRRGHFFETWEDTPDVWEKTLLPASECPRIGKEFLKEERRTLGEWYFQQEYECIFTEGEAQLFSYDLISSALSSELKPLFPDRLIDVPVSDEEATSSILDIKGGQ